MVWLVPHPLVTVGVDVGPPTSPVICIGQASVDWRICVFGLLVSVDRRRCMAAGLSASVAPIAARPVVWSLPVTELCFWAAWVDEPLVKAFSTFCM